MVRAESKRRNIEVMEFDWSFALRSLAILQAQENVRVEISPSIHLTNQPGNLKKWTYGHEYYYKSTESPPVLPVTPCR
jgi:hypothetical protein